MKVDNSAKKEEILKGWKEAILQSAGQNKLNKLAGIGFAMPGPFDYRNGIALFDKNVKKFGNLYGINIRHELQKSLNLPLEFPIRFLNDAACFAVGETWLGEASKYKRILALTLGTGFGATFIASKLPVSGKDGVPENGYLYDVPFQEGIADDYFSTRWFVQEYLKRSGQRISGVKELSGKFQTDETTQQMFAEFGTNLGKFLLPFVKNFNPDCVVLGGNISKSFSFFQKEIQAELLPLHTKILNSTLNESAALIGSAKLCDTAFYQKLQSTNR